MRKLVAVCVVSLVAMALSSASAEELAPIAPDPEPADSASTNGPGSVAEDTMLIAEKILKSMRVRSRDRRQCFDECQKLPNCDGVMVQMRPPEQTVNCMLGTNVTTRGAGGWLVWTPVARCAADSHCTDNKFCNGLERCRSETGSLRCVPGPRPCTKGQVCNGARSRCEMPCTDADGDNYKSASCGFDDCNDSDGSVYPGAGEICDTKDQDCMACSVGSSDADGDGFVSAGCSNPITTSYSPGCGSNPKVFVDMTLKVVRGRDCDDANAAIKPGSMKCDTDLAYTKLCVNGSWQRQPCASGTHCQAQPDGTGICIH
jgi:hypothetical protein